TDGSAERAAHERATVQLVSIFGHDSLPRHIDMLEPDTINLGGIWGKPRPRRRYPEAERTPPRLSAGPQVRLSQKRSISRLSASSGRRPRAAAWLSSRCLTCVVPGMAAVITGCETTYFKKTCAQLDASM